MNKTVSLYLLIVVFLVILIGVAAFLILNLDNNKSNPASTQAPTAVQDTTQLTPALSRQTVIQPILSDSNLGYFAVADDKNSASALVKLSTFSKEGDLVYGYASLGGNSEQNKILLFKSPGPLIYEKTLTPNLESGKIAESLALSTSDQVLGELEKIEGAPAYLTFLFGSPESQGGVITDEEHTCNRKFVEDVVINRQNIKLDCIPHVIQLSIYEK